MDDRAGYSFDGSPPMPDIIETNSAPNRTNKQESKDEGKSEDSPVVQALELALTSNQLREERLQLRLNHLRQLKELVQRQRLQNLEECSGNIRKRPRRDRKISPPSPETPKSGSKQPQLDCTRQTPRQNLLNPKQSSTGNRIQEKRKCRITPSSPGASKSDSKLPAASSRNIPGEVLASARSSSEAEERPLPTIVDETAADPKGPVAAAAVSPARTRKAPIGSQQKLRMKNRLEQLKDNLEKSKIMLPSNNNMFENGNSNSNENQNQNQSKFLTNGSNRNHSTIRNLLGQDSSVTTGSIGSQGRDDKYSAGERSSEPYMDRKPVAASGDDDRVQSPYKETQKLPSKVLSDDYDDGDSTSTYRSNGSD